MPDGSLDVREITPDELKMLEQIESDTGEDNNSNNQDSNLGDESEIRIELEDQSGNQKSIIIKVK